MRLKPFLGWLGVSLTLIKLAICWSIFSMIIDKKGSSASFGIFCMMILDIADGIIFRKSTSEMQRRFGLARRVMDTVSDRVCIGLVGTTMIIVTDLPFYIYGVELAREVLLVLVIGWSWVRGRRIIEPNNTSRTAAFFVGLSAMAWLNEEPALASLLIVVTAVTGAVGLWKYYKECSE